MRAEFEAATGKDDINFDDRGLFRLIVELVRAKELDGENVGTLTVLRTPHPKETIFNISPLHIPWGV